MLKIRLNLRKVVAIAICLAGTVMFSGCDKGSNDDSNGNSNGTIPDGTSSFWNDAYRQHHLNGKVKTVKTFDQYGLDYYLLEYDSKGNLIKDHLCETDNLAYYFGLTLSYDAQNRLTKVVYGHNNKPEVEVAEFGYDGSHTAYIPTNIYSMEDLRLQKGVSSVKYKIQDNEPVDIKCTSVEGNRVIFEGTVGVLASLLGNISKVEVECNGNYPSYLKLKNMGTTHSEATVTFGSDGVPTKVTYLLNDGETVTTEYTSIAGFLLMTKQYESSALNNYEYTYNDKGYMTSKKYGDRETRYAYEYDSKGNWTKKTESIRDFDEPTNWVVNKTYSREYVYW